MWISIRDQFVNLDNIVEIARVEKTQLRLQVCGSTPEVIIFEFADTKARNAAYQAIFERIDIKLIA